MKVARRIGRGLSQSLNDESFLRFLKAIEGFVAKVLTLCLSIVILFSLVELVYILGQELLSHPYGFFNSSLLTIFGLFLNILIALELMENIQAYLRHQGVQVQLVVATALIAVARKLIIFDFAKSSSLDLIGLGTAILSLSISYWLVRKPKK